MSDLPPAILPLPLYLPNLPRETLPIDFSDQYLAGKEVKATELLEALTKARLTTNRALLQLPTIDGNSEVEKQVAEYLSLLAGLITDPATLHPQVPLAEASAEAVPLSRGCAFTWTNFTLAKNNISFGGVDFELCSVLLNLGLWFLMVAKELAISKDEERRDAHQKGAFQYFAKAAGVFDHLLERSSVRDNGDLSDLKPGVYDALANIALAEAQSVTVVRNERKNSPQLISSLCRDIFEKYASSRASLATANAETHAKLLSYLDFKAKFYLSKAYFYHGVHQLLPESLAAGPGIRSLETALAHLKDARGNFEHFLHEAPTSKGTQALDFFDTLKLDYEEKLGKAQKDNDQIYFEKIPAEVPPLPEAKSNVLSIKFDNPSVKVELWTPEVYASLKAKEDAIAAARMGKLPTVVKTTGCAARFKSKPQRRKTVAIAGGGIGGLTVAHELLEKGYDVTIFEADLVFGGKAACEDYNENLVRDHSIKNFSSYYYCLLESMKRIPFTDPLPEEVVEEAKVAEEAKKPEQLGIIEQGSKDPILKPEEKASEGEKKEEEKEEKKEKKGKGKEEKKKKGKKGKKEEPTVFNNLTTYDHLSCVFPDGTSLDIDTTLGKGLLAVLDDFKRLREKFSSEGVRKRLIDSYVWKHARLVFMCDQRKRATLDNISYEHYLGFNPKKDPEFAMLQDLVEVTAAANMEGSALVAADQALKMFGKFYNPHKLERTGNVLNGTIQNRFIKPWVQHIHNLGGKTYTGKALEKILVDANDKDKISGFVLSDGTVVEADHYVVALPYSRLKYVITESKIEERFKTTIPSPDTNRAEKWGHSCHFALKALPEGATPKIVHAALGTPWSLVYQYITKDVWKGETLPSEAAPVQLWITASDAIHPGPLYGKPYPQCTEQEFMEELLHQIRFKREHQDLIVDAVAGRGLDWWDASERRSYPGPLFAGDGKGTAVKEPDFHPESLHYAPELYPTAEGLPGTSHPSTSTSPDAPNTADTSSLHSKASTEGLISSKAQPKRLDNLNEEEAEVSPDSPSATSQHQLTKSEQQQQQQQQEEEQEAPSQQVVPQQKEEQQQQQQQEAPKEVGPSEQFLKNGPALKGLRVNNVSENVQTVCEAPLFARELGTPELPTKTEFKNLFLAGECVQTIQLVSTMEKANEGGKRCAGAICRADNKSYDKKKYEYHPLPFRFVRYIDAFFFHIFG